MSDWLAVGDETGNWDEPGNPNAFLGVALVMARIEEWQAALKEKLDGQLIRERLGAPPRHLPSAYGKSGGHHLMDMYAYWVDQKLQGEHSLAEPGGNPLRQEVFTTLRWLAEHPRLITLGLWGRAEEMKTVLFGSDDPAIALGRAYGPLVGLALPFLAPSDRLLVNPGLRSENAHLRAIQRAAVAGDNHNADLRPQGDTRSTISVLIEEGQRYRNAWPGSDIASLEAGTLKYLKGQCQPLKKAWLPKNVLTAIADLGAGLLRLSCHKSTDGVRLRRDDAWNNVVFHPLSEITR